MTQLSRTRGVGSQLSKYHCFIFEKFADSVHNKEIVPQSEIFPELMKTVGKYSISRRTQNCLSSADLRDNRIAGCEPATIMAPILLSRSWGPECPSLNHDQTIFVFIRAGHKEQDPASSWPLPWPGLPRAKTNSRPLRETQTINIFQTLNSPDYKIRLQQPTGGLGPLAWPGTGMSG